jgi:hypothetical protein
MPVDMPAEPLWEVFTPHAIEALRRRSKPSGALDFRLRVLHAGGLNPSTENQALRAYKSAWEVYLFAAFACGLFDGDHGKDLRARLTGVDDDSFRSAMSECLAAWYVAGHLKLAITPRPEGRPGHPLEFAITHRDGDINVEVKAPHRAVTTTFWWGDDSDLLQGALREANKQFAKGSRNLLVLVPTLRLPIGDRWRLPIERSFIGEEVIRIPIDPQTGGPAGPTTFPFKQSGDLTKVWPRDDENGARRESRYTRVSAVLCLTHYDDGPEVKHRALIVHNPNAEAPLPREPWHGIPEFASDAGRWKWSDDLPAQQRGDPSIWDVLQHDSEWLSDPKKCDREVRRVLARNSGP